MACPVFFFHVVPNLGDQSYYMTMSNTAYIICKINIAKKPEEFMCAKLLSSICKIPRIQFIIDVMTGFYYCY